MTEIFFWIPKPVAVLLKKTY